MLLAATETPGPTATRAAMAPSDDANGSDDRGHLAQFAASVAHEVNQPLAAIVLNAGAALAWLRHEPPRLDQVGAALEAIAQAGRGAGAIVRGLRQLADKEAPETDLFIVDDAVREVLLRLRPRLERQRIGIKVDLTLGARTMRANRTQLQQVLTNLLINAMQALAGVSGRRRLLTVRSSRTEGTLNLAVEDNADGFDPACRERLFDAGYSSKADGMGMGLPICRAIAAAHGGRLWCVARVPHGSVFHLSLPCPDAATRPTFQPHN